MRMVMLLLGTMALFLTGQQSCSMDDQDDDGWTVEQGDCNDTDASVNPDAAEVCDGVDNNCNGEADEGVCGDVDYVGNYEPFPDNSSHSPNYLLGTSFKVATPTTLTGIGVIGRASGAKGNLGVYASDANGYPTTLVAQTGAFAVENARLEYDVKPMTLEPGLYWIMGIYDNSASVGFSMADSSRLVRYFSMGFSDTLPASWPTTDTYYNGQDFNYYMIVEN